MLPARDALQRLRDGNARFSAGGARAQLTPRRQPGELVAGQSPFAVVLGCSDSRVPVELVFDCDLGDLFVIRVAGNVVAPSQIGSVEFAVSQFGTRLVLVLGHSHCGAVAATLDQLQRPASDQSPGLKAIVDRVRPAADRVLASSRALDPEALMQRVVRANVEASVTALRSGSRILDDLARKDGLMILGAEYALDSGTVDFLEG